MESKGKKALIFGLARSGVGAANLLASLGAEVTVTDKKSKEALKEFVKKLSPSVRLNLGGHPDEIFKGIDFIVISPGVPLDIPPLQKARKAGIKIIGELELAYQIINTPPVPPLARGGVKGGYSLNSEFRTPGFLVVTGTNGKSTTTTLLDLMLKKGGFNTLLGGNIGNALTEEIYKIVSNQKLPLHPPLTKGGQRGDNYSALSSFDYIVAEVSSFQLEAIEKFRPKGSTILNITPDHMDRYHSMDEYIDAKARVFLNQQKDDFLVLNADDFETMKVESEKLKVKSERPDIYYFSRKKEVKGIYYKDGIIYSNFINFQLPTSHFPLIRADEIRIKGVHNLENAMAASAMALLAECPVDAVVSTLKEFPGLEHRLEFVREIDGVTYINDSKGTNVGAVVKSLESFSEPIILIAGGRDKAGDFSILRSLVRERVKALVLIGEAREKIKKALEGLTKIMFADDFKEAVVISKKLASKGDVVLLSPACASFDMFRDFEDRGRQFKKIVRDITLDE